MPITKSAKKALRQNVARRERNVVRKKAAKDVVKQLRKLVAQKKMDEAKALLPKAMKILDKTAKANTITKNTASRLKSRLALMLKEK